MTTVCPLILYLQSSKATLEDIVIIRHGRTRNMYNNKTAAMTLAYIVEWQLFTLENEWSILFITILNYIFMIYHEYSWGGIFMRWVMTYCTTDTTFYTIKNCTKRTCLHHIKQYNFTTNFQQPIPWYYAIH